MIFICKWEFSKNETGIKNKYGLVFLLFVLIRAGGNVESLQYDGAVRESKLLWVRMKTPEPIQLIRSKAWGFQLSL